MMSIVGPKQRERGYRVRRLEDGFPEWKMAGLPIGRGLAGQFQLD